jgi:hypothetical protein
MRGTLMRWSMGDARLWERYAYKRHAWEMHAYKMPIYGRGTPMRGPSMGEARL